MLWFGSRTDKAVSVMQEIKQLAVDIAVNQLRLAQYQLREIRPEDLPSPSTVNFTITVAANQIFVRIQRQVQSNSLIIIAGFYCPDVKINMQAFDGTTLTLGNGNPVLHRVNISRGTELIRRWPLDPVYADEDGAKVTEGYVIYYPDDVVDMSFFAEVTSTVDQVSKSWYLGVTLLPPGADRATIALS